MRFDFFFTYSLAYHRYIMEKIPLIKRFLEKDDGQKVSWLALTSVGVPVKDDFGQIPQAWRTKGGIPIFDGYKDARIVRGEEGVFKLDCSVQKSSLGVPIFKVVA